LRPYTIVGLPPVGASDTRTGHKERRSRRRGQPSPRHYHHPTGDGPPRHSGDQYSGEGKTRFLEGITSIGERRAPLPLLIDTWVKGDALGRAPTSSRRRGPLKNGARGAICFGHRNIRSGRVPEEGERIEENPREGSGGPPSSGASRERGPSSPSGPSGSSSSASTASSRSPHNRSAA